MEYIKNLHKPLGRLADQEIEDSTENKDKIVDPLERVKYGCEQCVYNLSTKRSLIQHVQSRHEIKNSFDHCYYIATKKSSLCQHIQSIHDRLKHSCEHCEFQTNWKGDRCHHVQS